MTDELRIDEIVVEGRHRNDMGDLRSLADSIDTIGLIHPIVISPTNRLVAGGRRIEAARLLGWDTIPVTVIHTLADATDALMAERDENTCRKDFTPTEAAAMRAAVAEAIRPLAEARKGGRPSSSQTGAKFAPVSEGKTREVAAKGTGYSHTTLDKVDKTKALADDETQPEPVREVAREALADMDATGKVDPAFKKAFAALKKKPPTQEERKARHDNEKLVAEQEALNRWNQAVTGLTNALSYARGFAPPDPIPPNYTSVDEFNSRLSALCSIAATWKES